MADSLSILAMAAALVQNSENVHSADFSVRGARFADIPLLEGVERSAAKLFQTVGLGFLFDGPTVNPDLLASMVKANNLWVAIDDWDHPIGFLGGQHIDGHFHIVEVSVASEHQGRGIGKALMRAMVEQVRREGYRSITLTTYRHLPWNGPWYARMGFVEVKATDMGRKYLAILHEEAQNGLDMEHRCVMSRVF